jgi:hypothetical protein
VFFRAWRGGKAVPRPAHSAALVTALQIFRRAMRGTTFCARAAENHVNPVNRVKKNILLFTRNA